MTAAETVSVTRLCPVPGCGRLVVWAGTQCQGGAEGTGTRYTRTEHDNCAATGETE